MIFLYVWFSYSWKYSRKERGETRSTRYQDHDDCIFWCIFDINSSLPNGELRELNTGAPIVKSLPSLLILFFLSCKCDTVPRNVASTIVQQGRHYFRCTDCKFLGNRFLLYIPVQAKNTAWSFSESKLSRSFLTMIGITDAIRIAYFNTE